MHAERPCPSCGADQPEMHFTPADYDSVCDRECMTGTVLGKQHNLACRDCGAKWVEVANA